MKVPWYHTLYCIMDITVLFPKSFLNNQAVSHFHCIFLIPFSPSHQLLCFPCMPAISGHALTQTFPKAYYPEYLTVNIT